jgi:hypothetical protein
MLLTVNFLPWSNLLIGMHWGQAILLSIRTTTDHKVHKQATNTGIEKPHPIFSGKFLKYCTITHIKHVVKITTSFDFSPVTKGPFIRNFHCDARKSWDAWDLFVNWMRKHFGSPKCLNVKWNFYLRESSEEASVWKCSVLGKSI